MTVNSREEEFLPGISTNSAREHAYLVGRGVRLIADLGTCRSEPDVVLQAATHVEDCADSDVIPFVFDRGDGRAVLGYAAHAWALDLYRWVITDSTLPPTQVARIIGLLHGYTPQAIRRHEERRGGRDPLYKLEAPNRIVVEVGSQAG